MGCCSQPTEDTHSLLHLDKYKAYRDKNDEDLSEQQERSDSDSDNVTSFVSVIGYLLALIVVPAYVTSYACTQALYQSVPHSELNGLRFLSQFIITSPFVAGINKCDVRVRRNDIIWVTLGCILKTITNYGLYGSSYYLPLGVILGIATSVTLILSHIITSAMQKRVNWCEFVVSLMCLCGVVMVIQPGFLFNDNTNIYMNNAESNNTRKPICLHIQNITDVSLPLGNSTDSMEYTRNEVFGYLLCTAAGITYALHIQLVKQKLSDIDMFVFNFWACIFGMVSSFIVMALSEYTYFPSSSICIGILFTHLITASVASTLNYRMLQLLNPVVSSLIMTMDIALSFVLQYTLLSGLFPGNQNPTAIVGAVLIFMGNTALPFYSLVQLKCMKTH